MTDTELANAVNREVSKARRESLIRAGVGEAYLDRNLSSVDSGEDIAKWMGDGGFQRLKTGETVSIETQSKQGIDAITLMARVIHLNGTGVRVVNLSGLIRMVEIKNYDDLDDLINPSILFVLQFFEASAMQGDRNMTGYQAKQIEGMLLKRMAGGKANVLQITNPKKVKYDLESWWGASFVGHTGIAERLVLTK